MYLGAGKGSRHFGSICHFLYAKFRAKLLLKELEEEIMSYINTLPLNAVSIYAQPELRFEKPRDCGTTGY